MMMSGINHAVTIRIITYERSQKSVLQVSNKQAINEGYKNMFRKTEKDVSNDHLLQQRMRQPRKRATK